MLKLKLEIIKKIVEVFGINTTTGDMIMNDVVEKLGDAKNSATAAESLLAIADAISLEYVVVKMLGYAFEQKSPKVQIEALQLTGEAIQAFGLQVQPKKLIDFMKKALQSVNATVRQATITTLGNSLDPVFPSACNRLVVLHRNHLPLHRRFADDVLRRRKEHGQATDPGGVPEKRWTKTTETDSWRQTER